PPVGPQRLLHLYSNPSHGSSYSVFFDRFPKRRNQQLVVLATKDIVIGWDGHLGGMHWPKCYVTDCLPFIL
ncbi:hypothetical protein K432DRAFT_286198, partial [Lepidopterella palustris CBS 459.81]